VPIVGEGAFGYGPWHMAKPPRTELKLVGPDLETRFYLRRALERTGAVLVLGAADGRLPLELAAMGRTVVGVEPSPMLRELAKERLLSAGERLDARVRLIADDPRSLQLEERFGLVFAPHNALGLAGSPEELEAMLRVARAHLEPGGLVAFDVLHPPEPDPDENGNAPHAPIPPVRPGFAPHLRARRVEGTRRSREILRLKSRPLRVMEVDRALDAAGLIATERFADFQGGPFSYAAERQVVVSETVRD